MKLVLKFRSELIRVSNWIVEELEQMTARINSVFSVEHKVDGQHSDVTADSLVVAGDVSAAGDLTVTGEGPHTFTGEVTAIGGDAAVSGDFTAVLDPEASQAATAIGPGVRLGSGEDTDRDWSIIADQLLSATTHRRLTIANLNHASDNVDFALQLTRDLLNTADAFYLAPHGEANGKLYLGAAGAIGNGSTGAYRIENIYTRDIDTTAGVKERGRTTPMGEWVSVAHNAGNFTASSGSWTVESGDQISFAYMLIGKTMFVSFVIQTTSVSATPATLQITIPGGFTSAKDQRFPIFVQDAGAAMVVSQGRVVATGNIIYLYSTIGGANWNTAVNNTGILGSGFFEIQ